MAKKRLKATSTVLATALLSTSLMGVGYASWNDTLQLNTSIKTGKLSSEGGYLKEADYDCDCHKLHSDNSYCTDHLDHIGNPGHGDVGEEVCEKHCDWEEEYSSTTDRWKIRICGCINPESEIELEFFLPVDATILHKFDFENSYLYLKNKDTQKTFLLDQYVKWDAEYKQGKGYEVEVEIDVDNKNEQYEGSALETIINELKKGNAAHKADDWEFVVTLVVKQNTSYEGWKIEEEFIVPIDNYQKGCVISNNPKPHELNKSNLGSTTPAIQAPEGSRPNTNPVVPGEVNPPEVVGPPGSIGNPIITDSEETENDNGTTPYVEADQSDVGTESSTIEFSDSSVDSISSESAE